MIMNAAASQAQPQNDPRGAHEEAHDAAMAALARLTVALERLRANDSDRRIDWANFDDMARICAMVRRATKTAEHVAGISDADPDAPWRE